MFVLLKITNQANQRNPTILVQTFNSYNDAKNAYLAEVNKMRDKAKQLDNSFFENLKRKQECTLNSDSVSIILKMFESKNMEKTFVGN